MKLLCLCLFANLVLKADGFDFDVHPLNKTIELPKQIEIIGNTQTAFDENGTHPLVPFDLKSLACGDPVHLLRLGESIAFSTGLRTPGNTQNCRFEFDVGPALGSQMVITCSQLQVPCSFNDQLWISELSVTSVGCFPTTEALTDVFFTYKKLSASSRMSLIYRADQNSPVTTGMVCNIQNQGPRGTGSSTTKRPPPVQTCGGPPSASSRIIDGTLVADNEFGFMAKLTIDDLYLCGASVLNSRWLLTAAHCVKPSSSVVASFDCIGSVNCRQSRTQDQIYIHPNWDDSNVAKGFDVALIHLSQDIQFSNAVWPVCLPANPPNFGENMKVIGFGNIATNGPTSQDLLMGFVKVEPMSTCRRFFGNGLGSTVFCASQNPSSTCRGDSGSFGGVRRNGRFEIDGITSFGGAICEDDPMGFMLVVSEKEWINSYINILV